MITNGGDFVGQRSELSRTGNLRLVDGFETCRRVSRLFHLVSNDSCAIAREHSIHRHSEVFSWNMEYKRFGTLLALGLLVSVAPIVDTAKILAVYPFPGKSHFVMTNALVKELIQSGHQITMITAYTLAPLELGANYTEILIEPRYDFWAEVKEKFNVKDIFQLSTMEFADNLKFTDLIGLRSTEHALQQPKVQAIINATRTEGVYDLLLVEQFYQEAFLALAHKYNIPVVTTSPLGYANYMAQMMGLVMPWTFVPHGFMPHTDHMNFFERVHNSIYSLWEDLHREYTYFPQMDELVQKYFSHLPIEFPSVSKMEKNISLMLLNSYTPLTSSRPTVESMIPVGGVHIYPPKALPSDIQKFLDEAEDGVIYFSLGSNIQSKDMPRQALAVFLKVFAGLKQRILWKFESEGDIQLPANVMAKKWLPQNDVLAHPNIRVFITHSGLFGTQEGVYHGVPMLAIPIYCDQHLIARKAAADGYALSLEFKTISEENLRQSLQALLEDTKYKATVLKVSALFRDRPMSPQASAVYWLEYVVRHKGARHLRLAGVDMPWYKYYMLDMVGLCGFGCFLVLICVLGAIRLKYCAECPAKQKTN